MRDYSKVGPKFWIGKTGKKLRTAGMEAQIVAMYLMTSPHANMLGLYYVTKTSIAHETGIGEEMASKGLRSCIDVGFCGYDEESEMVWVYEMAYYQIAEHLDVKDLRCKGVQNEYNSLPDNPFLESFFEKYQADFHMTKMRSNSHESITPSKPLRSQEQEQEQEQEHNQEQKQENNLVEQNQLDIVRGIFGYWQKTMKSPNSKLDDKRIAIIKKALKNYSPRDLCIAILGCSKTPHNMGMNDRNTKYIELKIIFRDADNIDRFIRNAEGNATAAKETIEQTNERIAREFLGNAESSDPLTIDMELE